MLDLRSDATGRRVHKTCDGSKLKQEKYIPVIWFQYFVSQVGYGKGYLGVTGTIVGVAYGFTTEITLFSSPQAQKILYGCGYFTSTGKIVFFLCLG